MNRNSQPLQSFANSRPWLARSGNPLQQLASSQAASQPHQGATSRPATTAPASRPAPRPQNSLSQPPRNLKFMSQPACMSQPAALPWSFSQPSQTEALLDYVVGESGIVPSQMPSQTAAPPGPANTAARLLQQVTQQGLGADPLGGLGVEKLSKKLEQLDGKQDALANKCEGIAEGLAGQGTKLESLEATCSELVEALRAMATTTGGLESSLQAHLSLRRAVTTECAIQTTPSLMKVAPTTQLQPVRTGPSAGGSARLMAAFKQAKPAGASSQEPPPAPGAVKHGSAPASIRRGLRSSTPSSMAQVPKSRAVSKAIMPPVGERRTTRGQKAAATAPEEQPPQLTKAPARFAAAGGRVSFSRQAKVPAPPAASEAGVSFRWQGQAKRQAGSEDTVAQPLSKRARAQEVIEAPPATQPAPAISLFDSLFWDGPAEEPVQQQQPLAASSPLAALMRTQEDAEDEVEAEIARRLRRHRSKLLSRRG